MKEKGNWMKSLVVVSFILYSLLVFDCLTASAALEDQVFIEDQYGEYWKPGEMSSANIFSTINEPTINSPTKNAEKLIAPGTSGSYSFTVHNTGDQTITYKLIGRNKNEQKLPLEFKCRIEDGPWIKGSEEAWSLWSDTFPLNYQHTLLSRNAETIQVMWRWPFERNRDAEDTLFGQRALNEELSYQLTLNVVAEGTSAKEEKQSLFTNKLEKNYPKTGDTISQGGQLLGISILVSTYLLWKFRQRNKKCE